MQVEIAEAFEFLLYPKWLKSLSGGRGAAKSETVAEILVARAHDFGDRVLCGREFQNSIDDSVYALIKAKIYKMGWADDFDIQANAIYCKLNGGCFHFTGLARNIKSLKSKFGYNILWVEEAETLSQDSIDTILPTIRENGAEIWFTWNWYETISPVYKLLITPYEQAIREFGFYEDNLIYTKKVSWRDNPWFPDILKFQMEKMRAENYKKYLHIWEGECNSDYEDSIIEPEWVDAAVDLHLHINWEKRGEKVLSFDPADSGVDAKATVTRHGMLIEDVKQWKHGDLDKAIALAFDEAYNYRADIMVYDSVGVGAGVKVGLTERIAGRKIEVKGFGGGESPTPGLYKDDRPNADVFINKRAQYWWLLRDRFERAYQVRNGAYHDPMTLISLSSNIKELDALKAELVRQQRKRTSGSRVIQLISKDEMRLKKIPSPNMADALMQSFAVDGINKAPVNFIPLPKANHYSNR